MFGKKCVRDKSGKNDTFSVGKCQFVKKCVKKERGKITKKPPSLAF